MYSLDALQTYLIGLEQLEEDAVDLVLQDDRNRSQGERKNWGVVDKKRDYSRDSMKKFKSL